MPAGLKGQIPEDAFENRLAVVEGAIDGQGVDVLVRHRGHLQFLNWGRFALREHYENVDVVPTSGSGNGGAPRIATRGAENVQVFPPGFEDVLKKLAE